MAVVERGEEEEEEEDEEEDEEEGMDDVTWIGREEGMNVEKEEAKGKELTVLETEVQRVLSCIIYTNPLPSPSKQAPSSPVPLCWHPGANVVKRAMTAWAAFASANLSKCPNPKACPRQGYA